MKVVGEVFSLRTAVLFFAGLVLPTVPMAAQQEVSPEHFDAKQSAARAPKPAPAHKTTANKKKQGANNQSAAVQKTASKPQESAALKTNPAPSSR